eukprot:GFYU01004545.1.p1 GENE.GFYU01004545.1~~GFYU01004545.1.p1  ORF type:complete len:138 (-),score=24.54 GFYU01004545.1:150-563(-)
MYAVAASGRRHGRVVLCLCVLSGHSWLHSDVSSGSPIGGGGGGGGGGVGAGKSRGEKTVRISTPSHSQARVNRNKHSGRTDNGGGIGPGVGTDGGKSMRLWSTHWIPERQRPEKTGLSPRLADVAAGLKVKAAVMGR